MFILQLLEPLFLVKHEPRFMRFASENIFWPNKLVASKSKGIYCRTYTKQNWNRSTEKESANRCNKLPGWDWACRYGCQSTAEVLHSLQNLGALSELVSHFRTELPAAVPLVQITIAPSGSEETEGIWKSIQAWTRRTTRNNREQMGITWKLPGQK